MNLDTPPARRRITIGTKLYGSFALAIVLLVAVGVLAIRALGQVDHKGAAMYSQRTVPLKDLGQVAAGLANAQRLALRGILKIGDAKAQDDVDAQIAKLKAVTDKALADEAKSDHTPAEKAQLALFQRDLTAYRAQRTIVRQLSRAGKTAAAKAAADVALVRYQKTEGDLSSIMDGNVQKAEALNHEIASTYSSARLLILLLLGLAISVSALAAFLVTRGVKRGVEGVLVTLRSLGDHCLSGLQGALAAMAHGDLTRTVTPVTAELENLSGDEIGDAGRAANTIRSNTIAAITAYGEMREQLVGLVGQVAQSSATVSAASQQMASTSEEAGRAVGEIAHAVSEVATGAERQVRMVGDTREAADGSAETAEQARVLAGDGKKAVAQASDAMASVRDASLSLSEAIQALGAKSERIGGIVDTITGIAGQTNLLALNAAIEAARAGEQGKGFAVVAEEVRKLAEESEAAATSISALIAEIQADTANAVTVVQDGARRTEDGVTTVDEARDVFERIDAAVEEVAARIGAIATASSEVAAVAEQSAASAEEVSASTEETAAATQEIAASARSLAQTATELEALVGRFDIA